MKNVHKEDIDALIEESLSKDEAEFYRNLDQEGVFKQWGGLYKGTLGGWAILTTVLQLIFTGVAFWAGYQYFTNEEPMLLVRYGGILFIMALGVAMLKLWHWMQMDKNAILREMKRLEFQVSVLSEKVTHQK